MNSLRFLLVNDYGLFSESNYEVQMYNAICEIMNKNKVKEKGVFFYKPFEYGYGVYEDKYFEDGIIEFEGTNRKIIIEVYGRNDEDYLKRKAIKSKILSLKENIYIYIPWEAYNNEPLPYRRIINSGAEMIKESEIEEQITRIETLLSKEGYNVRNIRTKSIAKLAKEKAELFGAYISMYCEGSEYEYSNRGKIDSFREAIFDEYDTDAVFKLDLGKSDLII